MAVKKLSKVTLAVCFAMFASAFATAEEKINPDQTLRQAVGRYVDAYAHEDYITMASFALPNILQSFGGAEGYSKMLQMVTAKYKQEMGFAVNQLKAGKPSEIQKGKAAWAAVIPTEAPTSRNDAKGTIYSSLVGLTEDNGETWFFMDGGETAKKIIADDDPALLQKITIPELYLYMELGDLRKYSVMRNGKWVACSQEDFQKGLNIPMYQSTWNTIRNKFSSWKQKLL
ncbi:hypothetical protein WDW86_00500 [Bdellovibrionota bacterium FG-2]